MILVEQEFNISYVEDNSFHFISFEIIKATKKDKTFFVLSFFDTQFQFEREFLNISEKLEEIEKISFELEKKYFYKTIKKKYSQKLILNKVEAKNLNKLLKNNF